MIFKYKIEEIHVNSLFELEERMNRLEKFDIFQIQEVTDPKETLDGRLKKKKCYHLFIKWAIEEICP